MRNSIRDGSGVTNVVSILMIIGIVVSLMGMVFATYLPAWGKDVEVQTKVEVMDNIIDLRSNLDTLSVGGDTGASLSAKIRLGSTGGPLFGFGRSSGSLDMDEESGLVTVVDQAGNTYGQGRGTVVYRSNHLYTEDQIISMEMGALIRNEGGVDILKGPPNIVIKRDENTDQTTIFISLFILEGQDVSVSGTQSYMISSTLLSEEGSEYDIAAGTDITITIMTERVLLWTDTLRETAEEQGLVEGAGNDFEISSGTDVLGNPFVSFVIHDLDIMKIRSSVFSLDVY